MRGDDTNLEPGHDLAKQLVNHFYHFVAPLPGPVAASCDQPAGGARCSAV